MKVGIIMEESMVKQRDLHHHGKAEKEHQRGKARGLDVNSEFTPP